MAILNNNPLVGASGNQGGYNINNSLRFRRSASAYLSRTPASAGNRKTFTWSGWVKRGELGTISGIAEDIFGIRIDGDNQFRFYFQASDVIDIYSQISGTIGARLITTAVYRDPSAWYHIVLAIDTTNATAGNRMRLYINGVEVTQFSTDTQPSLNYDTYVNTANAHYMGYFSAASFDGYITEINFIDGQQLTPSSFGETDTTTGVWKPKAYTGTYGTNGFYLKFSDIATTSGSNAGLGKDFSGNSNYWTTNNISVTAGTTYDAMTDVPTNTSATVANYCVFSPLWTGSPTLSNGNLQITSATTSQTAIGSMAANSGKFYFEYQYTSSPATNGGGGVWDINSAFSAGGVPDSGTGARYVPTSGNIVKFINGSATTVGTYATYTSGDVIGVGFDCDAGTVSFYKNNTLQVTITDSNFIGKFFAPCMYVYTGNVAANFGQRPFSYTPPTGYVALNTYNLPTPTILQGNKYMDATLYTGTGSAATITNAAGFKPDLVWIKSRSTTYNNQIYDSVRGANVSLTSNQTRAEETDSPTSVTAFNSNGFSLGTNAGVNNNTTTFVGWQWQAGQGSTSSNTSGSITSTVSVNTTAGFSVVTYTGAGTSAGTVGHGLGVAPKLIIAKTRGNAQDWVVYHSVLGTNQLLILNSTSAASTISNYWGSSAPTSTVFGVYTANNIGNNNYLNIPIVAYCWAEIAGFSSFGSYTGNGSADGPFVYTGFRPKFIIFKQSSAAGEQWIVFDSVRTTYNIMGLYLHPSLSNAESTFDSNDFLSNGFKIRVNHPALNTSGATYIYMAFAENPFKNSLAR